jgi:hypothetical protein
MQDDLEELDNDPVFQRVRAARPPLPATVLAATCARLPVRRRSAAATLASATVVAMLATTVVVWTHSRGDDVDPPPVLGLERPQAPTPAPPDAAPSPPPPAWSDLRAVLVELDTKYGDALRRCMKRRRTSVFVIASRAHGRNSATYWYPAGEGIKAEETCLAQTVAAMELPPIPAGTRIQFRMKLDAPAAKSLPSFGVWNDPQQAFATALAPHNDELRACLPKNGSNVVPVVYENDMPHHPDLALSCNDEGSADEDADDKCGQLPPGYACLTRIVRALELPRLPAPLHSVGVRYRVPPK